MKKFITLSVLLLGMVFLVACGQQETADLKLPVALPVQVPVAQEKLTSVVFKEAGIESEFTLPAGWTYKKVNAEGFDRFSFFDQNQKEVGGISLYASNLGPSVETSFDDCWRGWDIGSGEMNSGNQSNIVTKTPSVFGLDHYIYVVNDGLTSIAAESCGWGGHLAYIYWAPGTMVTNQQSLLPLYRKKPVRVMGIRDVDMKDDDFIQLVHNIAKSVTVK